MLRRAEGAGGSDFAVIRFKIPGFDDLTQLPRVVAAAAIVLLAVNRIYLPAPVSGIDTRLFTEILCVAMAVACCFIPYVGARLEEAARRQVSSRSESRQKDCMPTLAIPTTLPPPSLLDISWATGVLLQLTNADGLAAWKDGQVIVTRGLLRQMPAFRGGPSEVLKALGDRWRPAASVDGFCSTAAGIAEFPEGALPSVVLPGDTEAILAKPLPGGGQLVLWSSLPRAFDRAADRSWVASIAAKVASGLSGSPEEGAPVPPERCFEPGGLAGLVVEAAPEEESTDVFARYGEQIRLVPGVLGMSAYVILGLQRAALLDTPLGMVRGVETAQSRADLIGGVLATVLLNQALVWLSEVPMKPEIEDTSEWEGVEERLTIKEGLGDAAADELKWAWGSLSECTRVCTMVVFWGGECVMQGGLFRRSDYVGETLRTGAPYPEWSPPRMGALCEEAVEKGMGRYLAQLKNYPAKEQFQPFMPEQTQGLVLTPMKPARDAPTAGLLVLGVDAIRGVGKVDQAWITALAEKLAVSLAAALPPGR